MESVTFTIFGANGFEPLTLRHGESREFSTQIEDRLGTVFGVHWIGFGLDNRILWTFTETLVAEDYVSQLSGSYESKVDSEFDPESPDWKPVIKPALVTHGKH